MKLSYENLLIFDLDNVLLYTMHNNNNNINKEKKDMVNTDGSIKDSVLEEIIDKAINQNPVIYERLGKI